MDGVYQSCRHVRTMSVLEPNLSGKPPGMRRPIVSRNPRAARLGTAMRLARSAKGWSQAELAKRIDLKPTTKSLVGAWETGDRFPSEEMLAKIDKALGQDGHLLAIAGFTIEDSAIADEIQDVIDHHMGEMMRDINRLLGRE
jgi:transcriptional regulator with XRE-family HTH domain